jgi:hypothetical protein
MADYNSSIPTRTEQNGDVAVKVVDGTITSRVMAVNADGSVNITDNNGSLTVDGTVDLGATTLAALESITVQNGAGAAAVNIQDGGNSITVDASNLDIRNLTAARDTVVSRLNDGAGTAITSTLVGTKQAVDVSLKDAAGGLLGSANSPLVVALSPDPSGTEINNFDTALNVAAGATSAHIYTVTAGLSLKLTQIEASGSGKMKIEIQVETGVATNIFNTRFVQFNSTANTNMSIRFSAPITIAAGVRIRIIRTNKENVAQDVYSTISGVES